MNMNECDLEHRDGQSIMQRKNEQIRNEKEQIEERGVDLRVLGEWINP